MWVYNSCPSSSFNWFLKANSFSAPQWGFWIEKIKRVLIQDGFRFGTVLPWKSFEKTEEVEKYERRKRDWCEHSNQKSPPWNSSQRLFGWLWVFQKERQCQKLCYLLKKMTTQMKFQFKMKHDNPQFFEWLTPKKEHFYISFYHKNRLKCQSNTPNVLLSVSFFQR